MKTLLAQINHLLTDHSSKYSHPISCIFASLRLFFSLSFFLSLSSAHRQKHLAHLHNGNHTNIMKFSQALALGATLIAQTQACTRVHLRENGFRYDVTFFLDNQAPIVMTAVDDLNYKDPNNAATSVRINRGSDISGSFTYRDLFHCKLHIMSYEMVRVRTLTSRNSGGPVPRVTPRRHSQRDSRLLPVGQRQLRRLQLRNLNIKLDGR